MKISFFINERKPRARTAAERLAAVAAGLGLETVPLPSGPAPSGTGHVLIALGGDGTILRTVHGFPGLPVLGFNLGHLGYLSAVEEKDSASALELLAAGRYRIAGRTMMSVAGFTALNDVVIVREMTGHAACVDIAVDGQRPTRYFADGLVLATPTGSTAYSLSAGGPVLMPDSASFVVTPMNPHALGIRPMVVSDTVTFSAAAVARSDGRVEKLGIYADGERVGTLEPGRPIEIRKAERSALFVELEGYDPYAVLAQKLGWEGGSGR